MFRFQSSHRIDKISSLFFFHGVTLELHRCIDSDETVHIEIHPQLTGIQQAEEHSYQKEQESLHFL